MKPLLLLAFPLAFAACATQPTSPVTKLADQDLAFHVYDHVQSQGAIMVTATKAGEPSSVVTEDASDCAHLADTTTVTANGVEGTVVYPGGWTDAVEGDGPDFRGCDDAQLEIPFAQRPPSLDVVVDDGTGRVEIQLALDAQGQYQITSCMGATCSFGS